MCGISGIAFHDPDRRVPRALIDRMNQAMTHRGPDEHGIQLFGNIGLGHRRLSIIDLASGQQPMSNEDGSVWIVYNGEVYNHEDLRRRLEGCGHRYRTRCDTESIIHLYEEDGLAFASGLRGMFAVAIWDARTRSLVLARDSVGIKPLYYALTPGGDLVFASEILALFASGLLEPELDPTALAENFAYGNVVGSRTLLRGVRRVEPGEILVWQNGRLQAQASLEDAPAVPDVRSSSMTVEDAATEFWQRFRESVSLRLMSDVPVGVFLSGGLDSSLLVAALADAGHEGMPTFSVGYDAAEASELPFARTVAARYQSQHHEVLMGESDFFESLPDLTGKRGQPLTFSASAPLFVVSRLARDHGVKVVLAGEGSDELFAGYARYSKGLLNLKLARLLDSGLPDSLRAALTRVLSGRSGGGRFRQRLKRSFLSQRGTFEEAYLDAFSIFGHEHRDALLGPDAGDGVSPFSAVLDQSAFSRNPLEALLRFDQQTYLEELLAKQDHMSMAASIESRVPFLDMEMIGWARSLPAELKLKSSTGKRLLRRAARDHLPDAIIDAPKRGFLVPIDRWFQREGAGAKLLETYLQASGPDDPLNKEYLRHLVDEHSRTGQHGTRLWSALAFEIWQSEFMDEARSLAALARKEADTSEVGRA